VTYARVPSGVTATLRVDGALPDATGIRAASSLLTLSMTATWLPPSAAKT